MAHEALKEALDQVGGGLRVVLDDETDTSIGFSKTRDGVVVTTSTQAGPDENYVVTVARHRLPLPSGDEFDTELYVDSRFRQKARAVSTPSGWVLRVTDGQRDVLVSGSGQVPPEVLLATSWGPQPVS